MFLQLLEQNRPAPNVVLSVICEAVDIEKEFMSSSVDIALLGMNSVLMGRYIEFGGDRLLHALGMEKFFGAKKPFKFMESIY